MMMMMLMIMIMMIMMKKIIPGEGGKCGEEEG